MRTRTRIAAVATVFLLVVTSVAPGDPAVARTLFDGGRKAFRSRKYTEAVSLFQKAWIEDPELLEAIYWKGQAEERMKDKEAALVSYREFLDLLREKKGGPTSEEKRLRSKVRRRVRALAVAENEFDALEERYIDSLARIMASRLEKGEPNTALEAAQRILEVDPDHEEALAVRKKLEPDVDPYADVSEWTELVKDKRFQGSRVSYADGVMTLETTAGGRLRPIPGVRLEGNYGCEVEFRIPTIHDDQWQAGLFFGDDGRLFYALLVFGDKVELLHGGPAAAPRTLASVARNFEEPEAWHRLGFVVRQGVVVCWLDGERIITAPADDTRPTNGELGLIQTKSRVEWRVARAGRIR
jgi:tetratricopeptide (TPR) repeat protein